MNVFNLFFAFLFVYKDALCSNEEVAVMKAQITELFNEMSNLRSELSVVKEEKNVLKAQVDFLMLENDNIKDQMNANFFDDNKEKHTHNLVVMMQQTENSSSPDHERATEREDRKRLLTGTVAPGINKVAFEVGLSKNVQLGAQQTLEYDKVLTNIGNGYDVRHGHFTAPRKGLFLLSFTVFGIGGENLYLEMVRNGARISVLYSPSNDRSCGSQTTAVVLEQGDMVWVRHLYGGTSTAFGHATDYYNTFSGAIIFEL